jgi:hypothetical protein
MTTQQQILSGQKRRHIIKNRDIYLSTSLLDMKGDRKIAF